MPREIFFPNGLVMELQFLTFSVIAVRSTIHVIIVMVQIHMVKSYVKILRHRFKN
jgi:hypothetical protein